LGKIVIKMEGEILKSVDDRMGKKEHWTRSSVLPFAFDNPHLLHLSIPF